MSPHSSPERALSLRGGSKTGPGRRRKSSLNIVLRSKNRTFGRIFKKILVDKRFYLRIREIMPVGRTLCHAKWIGYCSQGRSSVPPEDSINELIIWKMNPSNSCFRDWPGVKFNSAFCMRNEQWICYENFSVFGQIENRWMDEIS